MIIRQTQRRVERIFFFYSTILLVLRNVRMPLQTLTQAFLISTFNQDLFISSPEKLLLFSGDLCENDARLKNIPELLGFGKMTCEVGKSEILLICQIAV